MENKRNAGNYYEDAAVAYLAAEGIEIIDRNVHMSKIGEIDIIGMDRGAEYGDTLVFFEVKYRKNSRYGYAAEAITEKKKRTIRQCAGYYIAYRQIKCLIRFDVIAIDGEKITWYKNAFQ